MENFISTFIFILPGVMTYFWLQVFGLVPSTKHTSPEFYGIVALFWLPISFSTLFLLNLWGKLFGNVDIILTVKNLNDATNDLNYLMLFLCTSLTISYLFSVFWSTHGIKVFNNLINFTRSARKVSPYSSNTTVWDEFFIKIENDTDKADDKKSSKKLKESVFIVHKIDQPEDYIIGSMSKASRPFEPNRALVLEETEGWKKAVDEDFDFDIKRVYVDFNSGFVVKELDFKKLKEKPKKKSPIEI